MTRDRGLAIALQRLELERHMRMAFGDQPRVRAITDRLATLFERYGVVPIEGDGCPFCCAVASVLVEILPAHGAERRLDHASAHVAVARARKDGGRR